MKKVMLTMTGLIVLSTVLVAAKSKKPLFVDPTFDPALVDRIDVFVLGHPSNEDDKTYTECIAGASYGGVGIMMADAGPGGGGAEISLSMRGYNNRGRRRDTWFYKPQIIPTEEMLSNPSKGWIEQLGDQRIHGKGKVLEQVPTSQWIMIITIDEMPSEVGRLKSSGNASLSLYLYDRNQPKLLWHDRAEEKMSNKGLLAFTEADNSRARKNVCAKAVGDMILKLPKHHQAKH